MRHRQSRGVVWLVVSAAAFGSLVVLIKSAVAAGINAETAQVLRFSCAAAIWWVILGARRRPLWPGGRRAAWAAGLGAFVYSPMALAYYGGTARMPGALAAMSIAAVPVVVAVLAWLLLRERLGWIGRLALTLAVAGTVMLAGSPEGRADPLGLLLLAATVLLYSLYMVLSKPLARVVLPSVAATYVITGAAVFYWVWGGLAGRLDFHFAPSGWLAVAGLVLIPTVLAMFALLVGIEMVGAARAAIVDTLEPVTGVGLSVLILGDRPGLSQIVGGALVILAAVLVQLEQTEVKPEPGKPLGSG